jgi:hypothetical protein
MYGSRSVRRLACHFAACAGLFLYGTAAATPFDGTSAATAGYSAAQILGDGYSTGDGVYWIDPDGVGGNAPFQVFADMTTNGGGWMLVRRIAGTGGWINVNDRLAGTASIAGSPDPLAAASWTIPYQLLGMNFDSFMFIVGDRTAWAELDKADVLTPNNDLYALNAVVQASSGVGVVAGASTNVLNRSPVTEDPWIGFEGDHFANIAKMFYGEGGFPAVGAHELFKNAHLGSNVFIREDNPTLTGGSTLVPEPGAAGILVVALAVFCAMRRRAG